MRWTHHDPRASRVGRTVVAVAAILVATGCRAGVLLGDPCDYVAPETTPCPPRAACARDSPFEPATCREVCSTHDDCAASERCDGFGADGAHVCTDGGAGAVGEPCNGGWDCRGRAICDLSVIDARCVALCVGDADCPAGSYCSPIDAFGGFCVRHCELDGPLACAMEGVCLPDGTCIDRVGAASGCLPVPCELGLICHPPSECLTPAEARAR